MSSNLIHITAGNYQEYFILYMDNELSAADRLVVENFLLIHPHLAEELDFLLSTKLPEQKIVFPNKEELYSANFRLSTITEELLLYIDNELPAMQKALVEEKIYRDKDYALQYALLMETRSDPAEIIAYPNKKELYRHTERVISFPLWMRIAAAIVLILFASLFFLLTNKSTNNNSLADKPVITSPIRKSVTPVKLKQPFLQQEETASVVKNKIEKKQIATNNIAQVTRLKKKVYRQADIIKTVDDIRNQRGTIASIKKNLIQLDVKKSIATPQVGNLVAFNKTVASYPVTTSESDTYHTIEDQSEAAVTDGDFKNKKAPAKGFFRKVSRFIERNTGIGTVNADNELLIGALALKLK